MSCNWIFRNAILFLLAPVVLQTLTLCAQVKVEVTSKSVTLEPSAAAHQFTIAGNANMDVTWSIDPAVGDIDPETGIYTAPAVPPGCSDLQTVKIIATSKADPSVSGKATVKWQDCREDFEASFYLGFAIDTFAASETREYANPDDAGGVSERGIGGFDFAYRLGQFGNSRSTQLWVFGERCMECAVRMSIVPSLRTKTFSFATIRSVSPSPPADELLRIIRNATTLEGFAGARLEFLTLNKGGQNPANVYLKGQAGFLKVADRPGDAVDMHHVGVGAIVTKGHFQSSYLEFGIGRTDLFVDPNDRTAHKWNRKKIDGALSAKITGPVRFFAQMVVDSDFGPGSDCIQTYIGLEFDLRQFNFWEKAPKTQ
jgi:hypothetical protein